MKGFDHTRVPDGFVAVREIDLEKNKKVFVLLNVASLVLALVVLVPALMIRGFEFSFSADEAGGVALQFFSVAVGLVAYMVLHELVHGVCIRLIASVKPKYGFKGWAAYAGAPDTYFTKGEYIIVALAPVVVWGVVLLVLNLLLPQWFWPIYLIQTINISGAVGDFYVTALSLRLPKELLVNDDGVTMRFYAPSTKAEA